MRLFITGATGLIGRRLVLDRLQRGDQVVIVSRNPERASKLFAAAANRNITVAEGNPATPGPWQRAVEGTDAVIHLAGASIADRRWTSAYKKLLFSSRIDSTHQVVRAIEQTSQRPAVLINSSAVGYYGDTGNREVDEASPQGADFLATLAAAWEQQARRAVELGVRTVLVRTAPVLDERGGPLQKMMLPFRLFAGGRLGSGRQYMPWIHWRDLMGLIDLALQDSRVQGPINAVAPDAVRNRDFARALGRVMHRPAWLPAPRLALRVALGELATALTVSQRIVPAKALQLGYVFVYSQLDLALESLLAPKHQEDSTAADRAADEPGVRLNTGPARLPLEASPAIAKTATMPAAPIKLLAIDVDGTLLCSDGSLAEGVIHACRAAERAGCAVVLATARPPRGMRTILQTLDLASPTINYNGALIWNVLEQKPQFHQPLSADVASQIVQESLAIQPELCINLDVLDRWYVNRLDKRFLPEDGPPMEPDSVGPLDQFLTSPVTKINLLGMPEQIEPVCQMIRERFWRPRTVAMFLTDPRLIQIAHPLTDKGIALQRIAKHMGLAREQVMAIGDASNDMGMIEWAGFGVAVDNAYPAVKALADAIVPSNDDLGVARAIGRYVLARR